MVTIKSMGAYSLSADLTDSSCDRGYAFVSFEDGFAEREELIIQRLGVHVWGRWRFFRSHFTGRWGEAGNKPLSPLAQEAFFDALPSLQIHGRQSPSLFLTDEGNLELVWEDDEGQSIQVEFGPYDSEVYVESSGLDEVVPNDQLNARLDSILTPPPGNAD